MLAIHQPNYLPYTGYFYKMWQADTFIFLDSVAYPQGGSFANRNRIKTPQGVQWLTVPVHSGDTYLDTEFAGEWKDRHLKTLQMDYAKAEYFDEVYPYLREIIKSSDVFSSLGSLNIGIIMCLKYCLEIDTKCFQLSTTGIDSNKNQMIVDLCKHFGEDTYLSGVGAKDYNDEDLLSENGIELVYSQYEDQPYEQLWGDFEPNLSIIDRLFNCGTVNLEEL